MVKKLRAKLYARRKAMTIIQLINIHLRAFPGCRKGLIIGLRIRESRENRAINSPNHCGAIGSVWRY
jgi:hypothetical protein